ncbi:MAG: (2Fe-2S)-binding protein [Candidatus Binatia bacterium]
MESREITLIINGKSRNVRVKPTETLVDVLSEKLDLIGTKQACGVGECGSCTVLMEGRPVNSCLVIALDAVDSRITTIEGLEEEPDGTLDPIQEAFIDNGAVQCGYCIPGMIMSTKALLEETPLPTEEQIRSGLEGNLCRCTGYTKIVDAVQDAARRMHKVR